MSGSAHWDLKLAVLDLELAVEVRQCPLRSGARSFRKDEEEEEKEEEEKEKVALIKSRPSPGRWGTRGFAQFLRFKAHLVLFSTSLLNSSSQLLFSTSLFSSSWISSASSQPLLNRFSTWPLLNLSSQSPSSSQPLSSSHLFSSSFSPLLSSALLYATLLYATLPYSSLRLLLLYSTLLFSSILCSTPVLLFSTLLYSTLRYSPMDLRLLSYCWCECPLFYSYSNSVTQPTGLKTSELLLMWMSSTSLPFATLSSLLSRLDLRLLSLLLMWMSSTLGFATLLYSARWT